MKLKKRVTQKAIKELASIIKNKGYWTEEVRDILGQYEYNAMVRINDESKYLVNNNLI